MKGGEPEAATVKVTLDPAFTVCEIGSVVTFGGVGGTNDSVVNENVVFEVPWIVPLA